ncbi:TonB family protein [uncultured Draconibacterium sp.]|uniref:energy transducer TonB n=1 Tax=uncultured Draconibacterium sp. TaxID=1573823 RepID=UPI0032176B19
MKILKLVVPVVFLFLGMVFTANSQEKSNNKDDVFVIVDEMPEYPGGDEALRKDIANSVKYPEDAVKKGVQGKVYVTFVVDENGKVSDTKIARGVDPSLDKEAMRVMNELKTWTPGKQKGEPVKVSYTVPINFALNSGDSKEKSHSKVNEKGDVVFFIVEDMPEFPGGDEALRQFIATNVKYPEDAKKNGIAGKVYISFVVDENGKVADTKVARGVDPSLDKEALRVVNLSPTWKPGKQRGEAVKVQYTVPISFALN